MKIRKPTAPSIVLFLLCLMYFFTYIDRVNLSTAAVAIKKEFDLSAKEQGWVLSAFGYSYALLQVPGGWLGDRFGPRKTLFMCGGIWALCTILTGFATGLISLILIRIALGFGEGATFPTATRAMQSWTPASQRSWAQGITHAFSRFGNALTPMIVTALMAWWSWRASFVALGVISMAWVIVWWLYYRDDPREHAGITEADLSRLPPHSPPNSAAKKVPWRRLIPRILPVTITYFCYGWTLWLMLTWLPTFFVEKYKIDLKQSVVYLTIIYLSGFVGDSIGGFISDYVLHKTGRVMFSRLVVVVPGMLGAAVFLFQVLYAPHDLVAITVWLSLGFFFLELVIGPMWSVPMDIAPQYSGTGSGLMNTGSAIAAIVSPLAFGYILDWTRSATNPTGDYTVPFYVSVGLLLIGAALSFTMHPDRKFVDDTAVAPPVAIAIED